MSINNFFQNFTNSRTEWHTAEWPLSDITYISPSVHYRIISIFRSPLILISISERVWHQQIAKCIMLMKQYVRLNYQPCERLQIKCTCSLNKGGPSLDWIQCHGVSIFRHNIIIIFIAACRYTRIFHSVKFSTYWRQLSPTITWQTLCEFNLFLVQNEENCLVIVGFSPLLPPSDLAAGKWNRRLCF